MTYEPTVLLDQVASLVLVVENIPDDIPVPIGEVEPARHGNVYLARRNGTQYTPAMLRAIADLIDGIES